MTYSKLVRDNNPQLWARLNSEFAPGPYALDREVQQCMLVLQDFAVLPSVVPVQAYDSQMRSAVPSYKLNFLAGRLCTERLLGQVGYKNTPVLRGSDRAPIWPDGIVGSISHTAQYATAAVTQHKDILGLGIDTESIVDAETTQDIVEQCCTGKEHHNILCMDENGYAHPLLATLLFSAKEAFYKAVYPLIRRFLDFQDVEIVALDMDKGEFDIKLLISDHSLGGTLRYSGRFQIDSDHVYTSVVIYQGRSTHAASRSRN